MDSNAINALKENAEKMHRDLKKKTDLMMSKLSSIIEGVEFERQKKTKINKMPATMLQAKDKSIKIIFDNTEDSDKFYGK